MTSPNVDLLKLKNLLVEILQLENLSNSEFPSPTLFKYRMIAKATEDNDWLREIDKAQELSENPKAHKKPRPAYLSDLNYWLEQSDGRAWRYESGLLTTIRALVVDDQLLTDEEAGYLDPSKLESRTIDVSRIHVLLERVERRITGTSGKEETPITLREFITTYCVDGADLKGKNRLDSLVRFVQNAALRVKEVKLPAHINPWKSGQAKRYYPSDLSEKWPTYQKHNVSLPRLKP